MTEQIHTWEHHGMGKAPFRCVGVVEIPSASLAEHNPDGYNNAMRALPKDFFVGTCGVCGRGLMVNYLIESADGKKFSVGCECVMKSGDRGLINKADAERRRRNRERDRARRDEKRRREREAREAEERKRNGGKTDAEIRREKADAEARKQEKRRKKTVKVLQPLADRLRDGRGRFRDSVAADLERGLIPYKRGWDLVVEILAKQEGRRGSKTYEEEADRIEATLKKASDIAFEK